MDLSLTMGCSTPSMFVVTPVPPGGTVLLEEATDSMQLEELPDRLIQEIT